MPRELGSLCDQRGPHPCNRPRASDQSPSQTNHMACCPTMVRQPAACPSFKSAGGSGHRKRQASRPGDSSSLLDRSEPSCIYFNAFFPPNSLASAQIDSIPQGPIVPLREVLRPGLPIHEMNVRNLQDRAFLHGSQSAIFIYPMIRILVRSICPRYVSMGGGKKLGINDIIVSSKSSKCRMH
jgi:hypothetical protein